MQLFKTFFLLHSTQGVDKIRAFAVYLNGNFIMNTVEAHFCGISSQSNIYGLTSLYTGESSHKVLVASSKRTIYCIECSKNQQNVIFSTREVQFTYIPGNAEIISMDAFNQACHIHDFVVGITFVKYPIQEQEDLVFQEQGLQERDYRRRSEGDSSGMKKYFNIYSDWEPSKECDLDNIAQGCLSICLEFVPLHLTHTEIIVDDVKEVVWLLSGNDNKIHLYREDKTRQTYYEDLSTTCFPEFASLDSLVIWMDFFTTFEYRITALGCKHGFVIVSSVKLPETTLQASWKIQHDGPVTTVRLFQDSTLESIQNCFFSTNKKDDKIHLCVGNALEVSVVYRDILNHGLELKNQELLPESSMYDCVMCSLIADIDMDGKNEVLLGTYGQQLLVYKWKIESGKTGSYELYHKQMFPHPLLALSYMDIIGDGVKELLVLTTNGLHILQHDLTQVRDICFERMKWVLRNIPADKLKKSLKID
ncbi:KICSTOR complex protein kaptin-like isoform X3 [Argiope bruennichi]|uniref:KICSTOR complex protein kaptin-like isoform X3 n=1 Tax=Argiope bruennichi TaxID=94029 RepID=UPI002493D186|nr:KICSTOR complex protein kaptin-like isoform X3 [Argiope bruennichi]